MNSIIRCIKWVLGVLLCPLCLIGLIITLSSYICIDFLWEGTPDRKLKEVLRKCFRDE